jgi:pyridoxamine 5'-phosphate oxidase
MMSAYYPSAFSRSAQVWGVALYCGRGGAAVLWHSAQIGRAAIIRRVLDYAQPLREADAHPDPRRQFQLWFDAASEVGIRLPEAMALATATPDGVPSVRMVLMKGFDERGFRFFTDYTSDKGRDLDANPRAALMFYWDPLGRQVRIEGPVSRTTPAESAEYVRSRPRGSQLSAMASNQSQVIASREQVERRVAELAAEYDGRELPVPTDWGGYRLRPERYEFWQNREDRLHDRLRYTLDEAGVWRIERLAP